MDSFLFREIDLERLNAACLIENRAMQLISIHPNIYKNFRHAQYLPSNVTEIPARIRQFRKGIKLMRIFKYQIWRIFNSLMKSMKSTFTKSVLQ